MSVCLSVITRTVKPAWVILCLNVAVLADSRSISSDEPLISSNAYITHYYYYYWHLYGECSKSAKSTVTVCSFCHEECFQPPMKYRQWRSDTSTSDHWLLPNLISPYTNSIEHRRTLSLITGHATDWLRSVRLTISTSPYVVPGTAAVCRR